MLLSCQGCVFTLCNMDPGSWGSVNKCTALVWIRFDLGLHPLMFTCANVSIHAHTDTSTPTSWSQWLRLHWDSQEDSHEHSQLAGSIPVFQVVPIPMSSDKINFLPPVPASLSKFTTFPMLVQLLLKIWVSLSLKLIPQVISSSCLG
jgi:hypothetical protein